MDIRKKVGINLRKLREAKGWSQEQLAFETGLHRTYISGIERGVRNPTVLVLETIASRMGIDISELVGREPS